MEFKCPLCTYSSGSITLLHVHCINAHPKKFFTCPWCTVPFISVRALQKHARICSALDVNVSREGKINTVLVNDDKCLVCKGRFNSAKAAIKHYKEQHLNFSYICDACEMYFQHNSSLDVHYATCHANAIILKKLPVPSAKIVNTNTTAIRNTKRAAPIAFDENFESVVAVPSAKKKLIIATASYAQKRQSMASFNELHCLDCNIDFASTPEIAEHFKIQHETDVFICDDCNHVYLSSKARCKHRQKAHKVKVNSSTRRSVEAVLQQKDVQNSVDRSAQVVVNQKIFSCQSCSFETGSSDALNTHFIEDHDQLSIDRVKVNSENIAWSTMAIEIKRELTEFLASNFNEFKPQSTCVDFVDLTEDY